ncbi:unnamed protein product [marine sediment metagenome]|uniref:Uncharacterized protein n=1 Tax=marine sediment metagenome TaxID=412755 RepID=X1FRU8_9ZZZZ
MLGVKKNTIYGWKRRWKHKKPRLSNKPQPTKEEAPQESTKEEAPQEITPESVADALLKRVVDALTEHERLLAEINECKRLTLEMGKALETERQEKDRILKIHNDQVKTRRVTDSETLRRLAKL